MPSALDIFHLPLLKSLPLLACLCVLLCLLRFLACYLLDLLIHQLLELLELFLSANQHRYHARVMRANMHTYKQDMIGGQQQHGLVFSPVLLIRNLLAASLGICNLVREKPLWQCCFWPSCPS